MAETEQTTLIETVLKQHKNRIVAAYHLFNKGVSFDQIIVYIDETSAKLGMSMWMFISQFASNPLLFLDYFFTTDKPFPQKDAFQEVLEKVSWAQIIFLTLKRFPFVISERFYRGRECE